MQEIHIFDKLLSTMYEMSENPIIHIFIWLIIFDVATGLLKSFFKVKTNSTKGLLGMVKHVLVMLLAFVFYPYAVVLDFGDVANATLVGFIAMYVISLIENLSQLGVKLPNVLTKNLEKLNGLVNEDNNEEKNDDVQ